VLEDFCSGRINLRNSGVEFDKIKNNYDKCNNYIFSTAHGKNPASVEGGMVRCGGVLTLDQADSSN
jgi:hypothetical protein